MESKFKFKIICGFREDQEYIIDANELHKAYWLFNNPDFRTSFKNGVSLLGTDVRRIVPDPKSTMGWNESLKLTNEDHNDLRANGVSEKLKEIASFAKELSLIANTQEINTPMLTLYKGKYKELTTSSSFAQKVLEK